MKLPVVEVAAEAYHFLWRQRRTLVDRASLPLAVVLIVGIIEYLTGTPSGGGGDLPVPAPPPGADGGSAGPGGTGNGNGNGGGDAGPGGPALLLSLAYFAMSLPFLVGWYRLVVLGPGAVAGRFPLAFTRLEGRFLLWMVVIGLVLVVPLVISGAIAVPFATGDISGTQVSPVPMLLAVAMFILLILASLRLSFVFPAIAAEEPVSFARAWEITKGNSLRLLGLMALVHVPVLVFGAIIEAFAVGLGLPFSLVLFVDLAISFTIMALGATAFGEAYVRLR
ncbi:hypothetical protein [Caenispirillum salinarum]|nr:hypothetical protein [Caenispirillum salinarum]